MEATAAGLTSLDLGGCRKLGDATARAIRESCPGLRELKMRGLSRVTATGVQSLALGCTRLEKADLSNCAAVRSAAPLAYLLAACPGMRSLSVGRTVPQGEVRALAARFAGVAIKNW